MGLVHYSRAMPSAPTIAPFQARLVRGSASRLDLVPAAGSLISVEDDILTVETSITCDLTDNLITAAGADAGAAPAAAALLYHAYVSNTDAFPFPLDLRLSLTAPTLINGVAYLGAAGTNAAHWRHVGWVFTTATPALVDTNARRQVVSRYNPVSVVQQMNPGYVDNDTNTPLANNNAAYALINAGADDNFFFIGNGDAVPLMAAATIRTIGAAECYFALAVGINGAALEGVAAVLVPAATLFSSMVCPKTLQTVEGVLYQVGMMIFTTSVNSSVYVDLKRNGFVADTPSTVLTAVVRI